MTGECSVCTEPFKLFGIGRCDHNTVCATCHFKMRVKQGIIKCGLCNANNEQIIITDDTMKTFADYILDDCLEFSEGGIFFPSENHMQYFEKSISTSCPFAECQGKRTYNEVLQYKKHLKE